MIQKVKAQVEENRERWMIAVATAITLLLFDYSALANRDLALAELLDAMIGCGILGSILLGWHMLDNKKLSIGTCLSISSAAITFPLLIYAQAYRIAEAVFSTVIILIPILCYTMVAFALKYVRKGQRWLGILCALIAVLLSCCMVVIAGLAVIDVPVLAAFWAIEIAAIWEKDVRRHKLIYALWLAVFWLSGLLCDAGISFYWARYIRRFLFPMSLFLWPVVLYWLTRSIHSYFEKRTAYAVPKAACVSLFVLTGIWALNLLFTDLLVEKYRITYLLYFLSLADLIIWRELGASAGRPRCKAGIGGGLLAVNIGCFGYYLYQKILLMDKAAASSSNGVPNIPYWLHYRWMSVVGSLSRSYDALEQINPQEFYWRTRPILNECRLVSTAYRFGFFPILVIFVLFVVLSLLLRGWSCKNIWMNQCVHYAYIGYLIRTALAVMSDLALLEYDRMPFPLSGYGAVELFFLIAFMRSAREKESEPHRLHIGAL